MKRTLILISTLLALTFSSQAARENVLDLKHCLTDSTIIYPQSFETDSQKLLENWYVRNYTSVDDSHSKTSDVEVEDEVIIRRLQQMPTIIEMPFNDVVKSYIKRYTKHGRAQLSAMLGLSHYYMPIFEQALEAEGLPLELKYLPVIESALDPNAVSSSGAAGLWQFILVAAKGVGLEVNSLVDERRDPYLASEKAAGLLKDLYQIYGDWHLAIAAYNCGPGNVKKAILRSGGSTDFWKIYPWLPRETRGYLPGFIAASYIMTYYEDHGICPMKPELPMAIDTIHVNKNLHFNQIVEVCGADIQELRALNPQYLKDIIPGENETYILRLTNNTTTIFVENEETVYKHNADKYFPKANIEKMLKEAKENNGAGNMIRHKIKNGETLGSIAIKYRVSVKQIMKWNNLKNSNIRAGKYLKIYK
jgi:membrane-bound lytic murein transglycosylase D